MREQQTPTASAVELKGLRRCFGPVVAVAGIDLAIATGAIYGLLGTNGAGKTTVIKMLTTLLPPSGGTASVAGYDILRQRYEVRRHLRCAGAWPAWPGCLPWSCWARPCFPRSRW